MCAVAKEFEMLAPKIHGQSVTLYRHLLARIRVKDNDQALHKIIRAMLLPCPGTILLREH
jgi:hypothetical protein